MSKLILSFAKKSRKLLYHSIPWKPSGDAIEPRSVIRGATIPPAVRKKLGIPADGQTPLVYAATRLFKALAFTLPKGHGKLFNYTVDAAKAEIVVACDRENFMLQHLDATIFSFPADGFVQLPHLQHQSVSTQPVPFSKTKVALKARSMEDLMRAGVQIFTFSGNYQAIYKDPEAMQLEQTKDPAKMLTTLGGLIKSGKVIWENQARGLNPNAKLAGMMGIKLKPVVNPPSTAHGL